jgi:hypothetical protein
MDGITSRPGGRPAAARVLNLCLLLACGLLHADPTPVHASSVTTFHTDPNGGSVTTTAKTDADGNTIVVRTTTRKDASGKPLITTVTTDPNGDTTTVVHRISAGGEVETTTTHTLADGVVDDEEIVVSTGAGRVLRREHKKWEGGRLTPDQKPSWQTTIIGVKGADDSQQPPAPPPATAAPATKPSPVTKTRPHAASGPTGRHGPRPAKSASGKVKTGPKPANAAVVRAVPTGPVTGLLVVELPGPHGMVRLNLPADLTDGDTVSGTMVLDPDGATPDEQDKNADELSSYLVDFAGQRLVTGNGWGKWTIPARAVTIPVILRDGRGVEISRRVIDVMSAAPARTEPAANDGNTMSSVRFRLPVIGQSGRPLVIRGPFHSDLAMISIKAGGEELQGLAVSPRQAVVRSPRGVIGPTTMEVNEGNFFSKGVFRNITCELSAEKTTLVSGEQTPLTLTVRGLRGLVRPVDLTLTNRSPGVVRFSSGDTETVEIKPPAVKEDGSYTVQVPLIGIRNGEFAVTVNLAGGAP